MKHTIEKNKDKTKINFELDAKLWDSYIEKIYQKEKAKINIAGFRKGHAPRAMIEKLHGKSIFVDDAFNLCFRECYSKVLDENEEVFPVEEPSVEILSLDENGIKFSAEFSVKPEVKLGDYTGIQIDKIEYKVTKKDIDKEIDTARARLARKIEKAEKDSLAENGDVVNLDYSGSVDGVKFEGGTAENQELELGSNSFIPGFEAQMIGMKKGEKRDLKVTFPDKYHSEDLAGKEAVFSVKLNSIFKKELPNIDDELAKEVSQFDTLKDWKDDIEKKLTEQATQKEKAENENALIEKIVKNAKIDVPDCMFKTELKYMLNDFAQRLQYMYGGLKIDDYFKMTGSSVDDFNNQHKLQAEKNVKTRLVLEAIIKTEKLEITEKDIDADLDRRADKSKKTKEEFLKSVDTEYRNYVKSMLVSEKVMNYLNANNKIEKKSKK
ncbi:MAG: trigger factor [Firmicutes bacterium]|nr:trigger factor [Bacillota bacterium]